MLKSVSTPLIVLMCCATTAVASLLPVYLTCERRTNPQGIDAETPRLGWALETETDTRAQGQAAYQILVASSAAKLAEHIGDLWDSGRVESETQHDVRYAGTPMQSGRTCWWKVRVWDDAGQAGSWSEPARWTIGPLGLADWHGAQWIAQREIVDQWGNHPTHAEIIASGRPWTDVPRQGPPPAMMRRDFEIGGSIRRATVYATALGLYELSLNGRRVGDHELTPEWTDYAHRVQYQTYDVTGHLRSGANTIGAILAEGWYAGPVPPPRDMRMFTWGSVPRLRVLLVIEHEDGRIRRVITDDRWQATLEGPIRRAGLYAGVTYDARREMPGWNEPGFQADDPWMPIVATDDVGTVAVVAQQNEPIRVRRTWKPIRILKPRPGVYVFDMGQNQTGTVRLRVRGEAGDQVALRYAEAVKPDGSLDVTTMRGHEVRHSYTLRGGVVEIFEPKFTYSGFRYVEVTGLPDEPEPDALIALSFSSDAPDAGDFECSNELINRIMHNAQWTLYSNLISAPLDCPQRAERLGWLGDAQAVAQATMFTMNMAAFYEKWLADVRDGANAAGGFPDFAPTPPQTRYHYMKTRYWFTPAWADAGVIIPWRCWVNYADRDLLADHYDAARRYIEAIIAANPDGRWRHRRGKDWGDWLSTEPTSWDLFSDAFHAQSCNLMSRIAAALGKREDAERYRQRFEHVKAAFNQQWVQTDGRIGADTQSDYAYALSFDLLDESARREATARLIGKVEAAKRLTTGIHSTPRLMQSLVEGGRVDLAYDLLLRRQQPSWGFMVDHGATTMWETWVAYTQKDGALVAEGTSLNHPALGAVAEWIWRHVAGINPDPQNAGYKRVIIAPIPSPEHGVTSARAIYHSSYGPIKVQWRMDGDRFTLNLSVPPNTAAEVRLPTTDAEAVTESGRRAAEAPGVQRIHRTDHNVVIDVGSGAYRFEVVRKETTS
jgi:alpha-L-rhamnosidase